MKVNVSQYFIILKGSDGRAGMAAVQLEDRYEMTTKLLSELYSHVVGHLPHYARPVFIRVVQEFTTTQTMKHQKLRLVEEGFDVNAVRDPLFVINNQSKTYEPLTASNIGTILCARLQALKITHPIFSSSINFYTLYMCIHEVGMLILCKFIKNYQT